MGRVARTPLDMRSVGDLAKLNTDRLTKGEKEAKDHEYIESSKLAKQNIAKQNIEKPWYHSNSEPKDLTRRLAKATPKQKQKYIKDGEIPG